MTPYYEQDGITIYHGDCREVLPTLAPVDPNHVAIGLFDQGVRIAAEDTP
jgi:hypothetical protein